jgi:putative ABC transport system permease protein
VVLLVSAGLLIRSFVELTRVNPGFVPEQAVSFRVMLQGPAFAEDTAIWNTTDAILTRLEALPGVTSAAAAGELPLSGLGSMLSFEVVGAPPPPPNVNAEIAAFGVSPEYVRALGAALLRGRQLTDADNRAGAPPVALINEAAVARWFPDGDPLGERVNVNQEYEIVGVIADVRQQGLREAVAPQLFAPLVHMTRRGVQFVVRGQGDMVALGGAIRRAVGEVNPSVPVSEFAPLESLVSQSVARPRFYTTVLTIFAASALVLAAVGLFGVLSYTVVQRSREIGVRLALGAERTHVIRMVLGSAMRLVGMGLAIGLVGTLIAGRVLESQLFGVSSSDVPTLSAVACILLLAALAASYLPARRASSLDPGVVLREG